MKNKPSRTSASYAQFRASIEAELPKLNPFSFDMSYKLPPIGAVPEDKPSGRKRQEGRHAHRWQHRK